MEMDVDEQDDQQQQQREMVRRRATPLSSPSEWSICCLPDRLELAKEDTSNAFFTVLFDLFGEIWREISDYYLKFQKASNRTIRS